MADLLGNRKSEAFSGWPMIICWLAMLIFAFHASTHMVAAGDTWVALACGRHFINHGVDTVEPFSANSHKAGPTPAEIKTWPGWAQTLTNKVGLETVRYWHPTGWVNQNWLTHVIFYWLAYKSPFADADNWSFNSLVYWKFAIYTLTVVCAYAVARQLKVNPALATIMVCFAMFTGRSFIDIRPAGFSNMLTAVFLLILTLTTYRNFRYIWLIVPLAVFWCNVHGGYIYLFIMLVPFVLFHFLTAFSKKWFITIGFTGLLHTVAAGFISFIAIVIFNPFHLTNITHTFLISVSKHAEMWRSVNEWHPAFEWDNPVGTGFPCLVLLVLSISVFVLWLFGRILTPSRLTTHKSTLAIQKKSFDLMSKIFKFTAAIIISWNVLIIFSMLSLDFGSFLIAALFTCILLLSIYKNFNFLYLTIPLTLAGLWASDSAVGFQGRYIYPFILVPAYVLTYAISNCFSKNLKFKLPNILPVTLTAIAAVLLMAVIFNPFKFNEPLWNISQFLNLQRPWYPRYEFVSASRLDYTYLFPVLYLLNLIAIGGWLILPYSRNEPQSQPVSAQQGPPQTENYSLPKIDPAILVIAALTIYMALRSRRFIPIAATAACPFVALLLDQLIRSVAAALNFYKNNSFTVPPMLPQLRTFFITAGAAAVLFFAIMWGAKFKTVYLDPWPKNEKLKSMFIRMTSSDAKPFYVCEFIRDNKMAGKMFNYWTEGGFIAWGQDPDPNTGKTPLQLFIDGRAQAAYEPQIYRLWGNIMSGGYYAASVKARGEEIDYRKLGLWVDEQLKKYDVWVVLMPSDQFTSPFMKGLESNPNWKPVFIYDEQKMLVDSRTTQGKNLLEGIFDGRTIYRNDFFRNVVIADILLKNNKTAEQGFDFAIKAFQAFPSRASVVEILNAMSFPNLRNKAYEACKKYFDDFEKNKARYAKQDGYYNKIIAALYTAIYLQDLAQIEKNDEMVQFYRQTRTDYTNEISDFFSKIIW